METTKLIAPLTTTFDIEIHGEVTVQNGDQHLMQDGNIDVTLVRFKTHRHTHVQDILLGDFQLRRFEPLKSFTSQKVAPC